MMNEHRCSSTLIGCCLLLAAGPLLAQDVPMRPADLGAPGPIASPSLSRAVGVVPQTGSNELDRDAIRQMIREEIEKARLEAEPNREGGTGSKQSSRAGFPYSVGSVSSEELAEAVFGQGTALQPDDRDRRPTINLGGRFDFDSAWYSTDNNLRFGNSNDTELEDGASIRRVNLKVYGEVMPWLGYVVELNFTNIAEFGREDTQTQIQSLGLGDTFLTLRHLPYLGQQGELRVGHVQEPFGLERMSSSDALFFLERSPSHDALLNPVDYSDGLVFSNAYLEERLTFAASFARVGSTVNAFGYGAGDGQYGTAVRITGLPVYEDEGRELIHLGAAFLHRATDPRSGSIGDRVLVRGGAGASQTPNIMQTQDFFVHDGISLLGVEAAMVLGRVSVTGEYVFGWAHDVFEESDGETFRIPRGTGFFPGAYVEVGYFLTPDTYRKYNKRYGVWDRQHVADPVLSCQAGEEGWRVGQGAVQLVARYSYLDLREPEPVTLRPAGAQPGLENDLTLGLVWHLNTYSRIMANYVYTRINSSSPNASGDIHGLGIRLHVDF
jgi:phosphate-selective porin OprO/OprP